MPVWQLGGPSSTATPTAGPRAISKAPQAILQAPVGHCGGTPLNVVGQCLEKGDKGGDKGGWRLRYLVSNLTETGPLHAAGLTTDIVARCAAACAACSQCAFYSVSLYNDDCSWYRSCDLAALKTVPGGYRTFRLPRVDSQNEALQQSRSENTKRKEQHLTTSAPTTIKPLVLDQALVRRPRARGAGKSDT